jgi:ABC-type nitrate/sulfonate/bicarbonate transport system substrate-binding protein
MNIAKPFCSPKESTMRARLISVAHVLVVVVAVALTATRANGADTVIFGHVGGPSPLIWPIHIGVAKSFFEKAGVKLDMVYAQSSAAVQQQNAANSINIGDGGIVDPIRAIARGAPVAILSIESATAPYALFAKPEIKSRRDLAGKKISVGGAKDITKLYVERMLAADGLASDKVDFLFAGSTTARFAALRSGAVDAAILTAPILFRAEDAGFTNLGLAMDVARDIPFTAYSVNRNWANANPAAVKGFLAGCLASVAWFYDTANREEAIKILMEAAKTPYDDAARSYDFFQKINFFARDGKVARSQLMKTVELLRQLGDLDQAVPIDRLVLQGVTELTSDR